MHIIFYPCGSKVLSVQVHRHSHQGYMALKYQMDKAAVFKPLMIKRCLVFITQKNRSQIVTPAGLGVSVSKFIRLEPVRIFITSASIYDEAVKEVRTPSDVSDSFSNSQRIKWNIRLSFCVRCVFGTLGRETFEKELQSVIIIPICGHLSQHCNFKNTVLFLGNGNVIHIRCPSLSCVYF